MPEDDSLVLALEKLACTLAGRTIIEADPATQKERIRFAAALGYVDARFVVFLHDTHGVPIDITLDHAWKKYGLRPDWKGIERELVLQKRMSSEEARQQTTFIKRDFEFIWKGIPPAEER